MPAKRRTTVLHTLLVVALTLAIAAVCAGWNWHAPTTSAGWTWDPDNAAYLYAE